jgi:diaminopimelate decarboxylase
METSEFSLILQDYNTKIFKKDELNIKTFMDENNNDDAYYIIDFGEIIRQYKRWTTNLPRVEPFYAVKCNPNLAIIRILHSLGCGFDCASKNEIAEVLNITKQPEKIIYANPCKESGQIKYACNQDINLLTFDSESELYKIKLFHPCANLILRIKTDDSNSVCKFSCKFGLDIEETKKIISIAKSLKLNLVGVSFHVGSNCKDKNTYYKSIRDARTVFDYAKEQDIHMNILDIGGGFSGVISDEFPTFEENSEVINNALNEFFPDENIKIIAEPGRYFVSSSHTLVLNIIGKKEKIINNERNFHYYVNDGVYGSFNCIYFDHAEPIILPYNKRDNKLYKCTIFGETCDSMDTISKESLLPDLDIGEWIYVENFGAYTNAASSNFNGFQKKQCYYIFSI